MATPWAALTLSTRQSPAAYQGEFHRIEAVYAGGSGRLRSLEFAGAAVREATRPTAAGLPTVLRVDPDYSTSVDDTYSHSAETGAPYRRSA